MVTKVVSFLKGMFGNSKFGVILQILLTRSASAVVQEIMNKDNQRVAYEFAKALHQRKDINGLEKAKLFNQKMIEWASLIGKKLSSNVINCLRELAVAAIKSEN